jgi:hypothetical protein
VLKNEALVPDALHRLQNRCKWDLQTGANTHISTSVPWICLCFDLFGRSFSVLTQNECISSSHGFKVTSRAGFRKHFFKRLLLFRRTVSVSLHRLIRASMGSFPVVFAAPSQNREYPDTFLHSVEVVTCTHKRSKPCYTTR